MTVTIVGGGGGGGCDADMCSPTTLGGVGGHGASGTGSFAVTSGHSLKLTVGAGGGSTGYAGAGAGASSIIDTTSSTIIAVAGGGGGGALTSPGDGGAAGSGPGGGDGVAGGSNNGQVGGAGGTLAGLGGAGGAGTSTPPGDGGAGGSTGNSNGSDGYVSTDLSSGDGGGGGAGVGITGSGIGGAGFGGSGGTSNVGGGGAVGYNGGGGGGGYGGGGGGGGDGGSNGAGGGGGSSYGAGLQFTLASNGGAVGQSGGDGSIVLTFTALPPPTAGAVSTTVAFNSSNNVVPLNLGGGAASSVSVATGASHGTATASGTSITYTPTTNYGGADSFTYTATNINGTSSPATVTVTVQAGPATQFNVSAPASVTAGSPASFTVTARDAFNNTATSYGGTVHFTSSDGQAVLPANSALINGVRTFSATLKTTGSQTLTATDTVTASITGASANIAVGSAAATHFSINAVASATAGTSMSFTVTALDAFNNTVTGYAGTVHFTSSDGQAVLPANTVLSNGAGSFLATLKTAGSQTITATDTVGSSITGTSGAITLSAAAASQIVVNAPATATAGVAFNASVAAKDPFGNTAASYAGTLFFSSSDGAAVLPADASLSAGVGSFSVTLNTAGSKTVTATDTVTLALSGTSSAVTVSTPPPVVTGLQPNAGPTTGGTSVAITGTQFLGATAVKFGASNATSFVVNSATSITAISPPGSAGLVDVTVTTAGGTSAVSGPDQFTYAVRQTQAVAAAAGGGTVSVQISGGSPGCSIDTNNTGPMAAPSAYQGSAPPLGALKVRITGCSGGDTVTVSASFSNLAGMSAKKYGPTPTSQGASVWYTPNGLSINGNTITYAVTDNGLGDDSFAGQDGIINDPIVPVPVLADATGIPALSPWALGVLAALLAGVSAGGSHRRRSRPKA